MPRYAAANGGRGLEQSQEYHPGLPSGWTQPSGSVGSQGKRAGQRQKRFQADFDQNSGDQVHRESAEAGSAERPVHDDSLDELYAGRVVQSHGGDLPDDDGLHDRQSQPVGPAGTTDAEGFSELRFASDQDEAGRCSDAAVCHVAPSAAGKQRRREGGIGRISG